MKINCEHCDKDLRVSVSKSLEQFEVGKVICPHCNKENKRYLSESDMLLYFTCMIVIYCTALILTFNLMNYVGWQISTIIIIATLFIAYYLSKVVVEKIYIEGIFKKDYKNYVFNEDVQATKKGLKRQYILFILVALMLGTQPQLLTYAIILLGAFFVLMVIKCYLCIKNERVIATNKTK